VTFFLTSPQAQAIAVDCYLDDGPGAIYVNGAQVASPSGRATANVNVPAGPFALSFLSCSRQVAPRRRESPPPRMVSASRSRPLRGTGHLDLFRQMVMRRLRDAACWL